MGQLLVFALPAIIYAIHALRFGAWIVDDAGITFAYARNFAHGYGLVSQPGMSPVEGYSNFSWLLLLAPFFRLSLFDPVITPKLISFLLVLATFVVVYQALRPMAGRRWMTFAAFTLSALNTSFVAWTISGLENPLYLFLVSLMLWGAVQVAFDGKTAVRYGLFLGVLAALIGITRPDGLVYVLAFPAILLPARKLGWKRKGILLLAYVAAFAGVYGLFIGFRLAYFGVPLPNTYYMKGGPQLQNVINLLTLRPPTIPRTQGLLRSVVGGLHELLPLVLAGGSLFLIIVRRWTGRLWALLVFAVASLAVFLLLPPDWMAEYRFATVFIVLVYLFSAAIIETLLKRLPPLVSTAVTILLILVAVGGAFQLFSPRSTAFSRSPTVPLQNVKTAFADRFDGYGQAFGLQNASVLLPDVGGMLYYSSLTVYDLAGLTDRTVARYLGRSIYRPGFYEYVFETVMPTFIHTHGFWTQLARLEDDPRFAELYVPICSYTDPWVRQSYNVSRQSGDFVLRSIAEAHPAELDALRQRLDENCNLK